MGNWIIENGGTLLVSGVLILLVIVVLCILIKNKKRGKHLSCGGDCSKCMMGEECSQKKNP